MFEVFTVGDTTLFTVNLVVRIEIGDYILGYLYTKYINIYSNSYTRKRSRCYISSTPSNRWPARPEEEGMPGEPDNLFIVGKSFILKSHTSLDSVFKL